MINQRPDALEAVLRTSYPRLYASADGETHFQDVPVFMAPVVYIPNMPEQPLVDAAPAQSVSALTFSRLEADFFGEWHPAPRRQFVFVLSGGIELTVTDGEKRTFGPGGVYLVEDTTGRGHQTRALGTEECLAITVAADLRLPDLKAASGSAEPAASLRSSLVGTWQLLSCELRTADGDVSYPWGPDAIAYLIYTQDGHVSYQVAVANRPKFSSSDLFGGTVQEKVAAAETFQSYCGTYELQGDKVVHHVEVSSFPNWVGADQVRFVQLTGDVLSLSSAPFVIAGALQTAHLSWRRATPV